MKRSFDAANAENLSPNAAAPTKKPRQEGSGGPALIGSSGFNAQQNACGPNGSPQSTPPVALKPLPSAFAPGLPPF